MHPSSSIASFGPKNLVRTGNLFVWSAYVLFTIQVLIVAMLAAAPLATNSTTGLPIQANKTDENKGDSFYPLRCLPKQPCGWEVFRPEQFRSVPSYFIYSPCRCSEEQQCARHSEDLSISSYIYKCKTVNGTDDLSILMHAINYDDHLSSYF